MLMTARDISIQGKLIFKKGSLDDRQKLLWNKSYLNPVLDIWYENQQKGNCQLFLVEFNNFPIAEIWMLFRPDQNLVELARFNVFTALRNYGIGTWLIGECEEYAKREGFELIKLGVEIQNIRAIKLYEKLGYKKIDQKKDSWQEVDPKTGKTYWYNTEAYIMGKRLSS